MNLTSNNAGLSHGGLGVIDRKERVRIEFRWLVKTLDRMAYSLQKAARGEYSLPLDVRSWREFVIYLRGRRSELCALGEAFNCCDLTECGLHEEREEFRCLWSLNAAEGIIEQLPKRAPAWFVEALERRLAMDRRVA